MKTVVLCCQEIQQIKEIIRDILRKYAEKILFAVPHTSSRPEILDINGVHGYYVSEEAMKKLIKRELLIEYSQNGKTHLGTSIETIEKIHQLNRLCLMVVCEDGLKMLQAKHFPAKYIYYDNSIPSLPLEPPLPPLQTTNDEKELPPEKTSTEIKEETPSPSPSTSAPSSSETPQPPPPSSSSSESSQPSFHYDFIIQSSEPSSYENFHSELIHWFPELKS